MGWNETTTETVPQCARCGNTIYPGLLCELVTMNDGDIEIVHQTCPKTESDRG
jgi:hypothetical protein